MKSQAVIFVMVMVVVVLFVNGCASICYPNRTYVNPNRRGSVDWGMYILNIPWDIITLGSATAIDMGTGAYWKPLPEGKIRTEWGAIIDDPNYKKQK